MIDLYTAATPNGHKASLPFRLVDAALSFIVPQDTKPHLESSASSGGIPEVSLLIEERVVAIHDMRAEADTLSIDRQGFELLRHATSVDDLYDDTAVQSVYERELETFLIEATGADRVQIFDYTRRSDYGEGAPNPEGQRGPAGRVHVDYTVASGPIRAADTLGADEVERILRTGGRIAQVNVWRPIAGPVQSSPLALADARSVGESELVATPRVSQDRIGEIYLIAHAPGQKWYWAPEMERDEVLLIKGWDSLQDGRARFTPHGSFTLPDQSLAPPRESIEARTYLVFEGLTLVGAPRSAPGSSAQADGA